MQTLQTIEKSTMVPADLVNFAESMARVVRIGIYYPLGHVVLDQAASKCVQQLKEITSGHTHVHIEITDQELLINDLALPQASVVIQDLHSLLVSLGLAVIDIDRVVQHNQFLKFIRNLLRWRAQLENTRTFIEFAIGELPDTIRIVQREYTVEGGSDRVVDGQEQSRREVDELCSALRVQGLSEEQVENCRKMLLDLSMPPDGKHMSIAGYPHATWEDVRRLLVRIVTKSFSPLEQRFDANATAEINIIANIFHSLERDLENQRGREAINLLVSHLSSKKGGNAESAPRALAKEPNKKRAAHHGTSMKLLSVSELQAYAEKNRVPEKILQRIVETDRSEELSIYMQLIGDDQTVQLRDNLEQRLRSILTREMTSRERDVLIGGIKYFIDIGDFAYFRRLMLMVLQLSRGSNYLSSLELLVEFWSKMPFEMHLRLWPYVVNELLAVGRREDNGAPFLEATEIAAHLSLPRMQALMPELEAMDSFQSQAIGEVVFRAAHTAAYHLYGFLLQTSLGERLLPKIIAELRADPQDTMIGLIADLLDPARLEHQRFVVEYLSLGRRDEPPLHLRMMAGDIILERLRALGSDERDNPGTVALIQATTEYFNKGTLELLFSITHEKKLRLLPTWPKECRTAATRSLMMLKRRNLKVLQ